MVIEAPVAFEGSLQRQFVLPTAQEQCMPRTFSPCSSHQAVKAFVWFLRLSAISWRSWPVVPSSVSMPPLVLHLQSPPSAKLQLQDVAIGGRDPGGDDLGDVFAVALGTTGFWATLPRREVGSLLPPQMCWKKLTTIRSVKARRGAAAISWLPQQGQNEGGKVQKRNT
mmetsp:Transcript_28555/g.43178  ORF Transcript_28555/g.43178 Transcript_28555/m.43178 type:complete len:168 (+) Transcript_28555:36-539(+)